MIRGTESIDIAVLSRPKEADQPAALADEFGLVLFRRANLYDNIRRRPKLSGVIEYSRSRLLIGGVRSVNGLTRPGFDRDIEAQLL